jgi:hypothetical protein
MRAPPRLAWVAGVAFVLVGGVAALLLERNDAPMLPNAVDEAGHGGRIEPETTAPDQEPVPSAAPALQRPAAPAAELPARTETEEDLGVDLALVDAMTKKPRDDAAAWHVDPDADAEDRKKLWRQSDLLVERCGVALDVDKEGHVRLPDLAEVEVVARAADRFGRASVRRSSGEHQRLLLWPDSPLKVRVVDRHGRPCGDLPVALDVVYLSKEALSESLASLIPPDPLGAGLGALMELGRRLLSAERDSLWRGTTSKSDGEAEVPHGHQFLVDWCDPDLVVRSKALRFHLELPTSEAATALVDPRMDFHQPVVLVAPPFVTLSVSIFGPDDRLYPYEVQLTSRLATAEPAGDEDDPSDSIASARKRIASSKRKMPLAASSSPPRPQPPTGSAVSAGEKPVEMRVPAGASIELEAVASDSHFETTRTTLTAPAEPDRFADVVLRLTLKKKLAPIGFVPRVFGRAIDPDGRPLLDERIGWELVDPHRHELFHRPEGVVRADHRGVFVFPMPRPDGQRSVAVRLFAPCPREDSGLSPTLGTLVELGDPDRKSDLDLGDVKLERLPLILSGRVVDPEGRGLPHPRLDLWAANSRLRDHPDAMFWSSRSGSFTIDGETDERSLRVAAVLDGWYMPGTTIDEHGSLLLPARSVGVGTSDLVIELHRCGEAHGELLLDVAVDPSAISLESLPHAPATRVVREDGTRFRIVGLPGLCDLSVKGSAGCRLTLIDRIELREAASTDDTRLQPLDLTGVVRMPVTIVDPAGSPLPGATLAFTSTPPDPGNVGRIHADPFGREVIVALKQFGPLIVLAPGLRLTRVPLESIEKTIRLPPGIHVTASLQGITGAPPNVFATLTARYRPARSDVPAEAALLPDFFARSAAAPLGDAKFEIDVSAPGNYSLAVGLSDPGRGTEGFLYAEPRIVTISDAREAQHIELRVPEDSLRRALQTLER